MTELKALQNMTKAELWRKFWWIHPALIMVCGCGVAAFYFGLSDLVRVPAAIAGFDPLVKMPTFKMTAIYFGGVVFIVYGLLIWVFVAPKALIVRYRAFAACVVSFGIPVYLVASLLFGLGAWYFLTSAATQAGYRDCGARERSVYGPVSVMWGRDEAACRAYCADMATKRPRLRCPADGSTF